MTLTPSQRASLASALQIMFDGLDAEDIAQTIIDAIGWSRYSDILATTAYWDDEKYPSRAST